MEAIQDALSLKELNVTEVNKSLPTTAVNFNSSVSFEDGKNIGTGTSNGTKIGGSSSQKIGFWGVTPVVQQVLATGGGATVDNVITLLQTLGLCKQS